MRRTLRVIGSLAGLTAVGVLLAGLVWMFGVGLGAGGQPQVAQQPYPPPHTPTMPAPSPPGTPSLEPYPPPATLTPEPTSTQTAFPTPVSVTRVPFPTFTPAPTWTPVPGAAGAILYRRRDPEGSAIYQVPVDEVGRPVVPPARIPSSLGYTGPLYPSPDSRYVAIVRGVETGHEIAISHVGSAHITPLIRDGLGTPGKFLNWHPNSREVLYTTSDTREPGLWIVDIHSGQHKRISELEPDGAAISPDGTKVVFSHWRGFGVPGEMWMINADGTEPRLLFTSGVMFGLALSPGGTKMVYVGCESGDELRGSGGGLCVMDANGQNRRQLSSNFNGGYGFLPVWSPDSRTIAFVARELPEEKPDPNNPPDWDELAFRGANIHLVDVNTGEEKRLLPGSVEGNIDPAWSPDGFKIAFSSNRSGTAEIWVVNADGTGLRQLTDEGKPTRYPVWLRR